MRKEIDLNINKISNKGMNSNKIVHIGYPKTASTFLQQNVFANTKNYQIIDFFTCKEISHDIILNGYFSDFASHISKLPEGNLIFSYEGLVGNFASGIGINSTQTADILKKIGFNKVIVVTRKNKKKWFDSIFNHYVKTGGRLSYKDYIKNPKNSLQMRQYYPEMMKNADKLIDHYSRVFGKKNVLHLYSEEIYSPKSDFKIKLEKFAETEIIIHNKRVNESVPNWMIKVYLFTNNFTSSIMNPTTLFKYISIGYIRKIMDVFVSRKMDKGL